ncbi:2'-phosphotransferase [Ranunculus cassubicifolius]
MEKSNRNLSSTPTFSNAATPSSSASSLDRMMNTHHSLSPTPVRTTPTTASSSVSSLGNKFQSLDISENIKRNLSTSAHSRRSNDGGGGRGLADERRSGGGRGGGNTKDKIDALGRLLTRILRHMASELQLNMRSDGYVKVADLLRLNLKTFANIPLRSHTVDDIKEAVRKDNKQRFGLLEENGELLIRANQGHTVTTIESESLLKTILSAEEAPICVHGTYKRNLESILQSGLKRMKRLHVHFSRGLPSDGGVISGMRRDVNVLIFLNVRKALEDGMKLYISENKVILTEGFDGVVPVKYFDKIETWPKRESLSFEIARGLL